jgi:hypothetical protein
MHNFAHVVISFYNGVSFQRIITSFNKDISSLDILHPTFKIIFEGQFVMLYALSTEKACLHKMPLD